MNISENGLEVYLRTGFLSSTISRKSFLPTKKLSILMQILFPAMTQRQNRFLLPVLFVLLLTTFSGLKMVN